MSGEEMRARLAEGLRESTIVHPRDEVLAREFADLLLPVVRAIVAEELRAAANDWEGEDEPGVAWSLRHRADRVEAGS